jgi:hypothetical protein
MSQLRLDKPTGISTHTALIPGRRREQGATARGILIGLAISVPLWLLFGGLAWWGARQLLG